MGNRLALVMAAAVLAWGPPDPIVSMPRSSPRVQVRFDLPTPSSYANDYVMVRANDSPLEIQPPKGFKGSPRAFVPFDLPQPSTYAKMYEVIRLNDTPTPIPPVVVFNGSPRVHVPFDFPVPSTDADLFHLIRLNDSPTPVPPVVAFNGSPRTHVKFDAPPPSSGANLNATLSTWIPQPDAIVPRARFIQITAFVPDFPPPSSPAEFYAALGWWNLPPPMPIAGPLTNPRIHVKFDLPIASNIWQQLALNLVTWIPGPPAPPAVGFKGSPRAFIAFDFPPVQTSANLANILTSWITLPGNLVSTARVPSGTAFVPDNPPRYSTAVLNSIVATWNIPTPGDITGPLTNPRIHVRFDFPPVSLDGSRLNIVNIWNLPDPRLPVVGFKGSPRTFISFDSPPGRRDLTAILAAWNEPPAIQQIGRRILSGRADNPPPRTLATLFSVIDQWKGISTGEPAVLTRYNKLAIPAAFIVNYLSSMGLSERVVDLLVSNGVEIDARGRIFIDVSNMAEVDVRRLIDLSTRRDA